MREIKFRAWDKVNNKMYDWKWLFSFKSVCGLFDNSNLELMQFTGLLDSSGKEIYEGDIIIYDCNSDSEKAYVRYIEWESGAFFINDDFDDNNLLRNFNEESIVIGNILIGNIYQNKELLKSCEEYRISRYSDLYIKHNL